MGQLRLLGDEVAGAPQLGAHLPVARRLLARPDDLADLLVLQQEGIAQGEEGVDPSGAERRSAGLRVEVEDAEVVEVQAVGLQQLGERQLPGTAAMQGDALALEVGERLGAGVARDHQVDMVAAAAGSDQPGRHAGGVGDDRRQVAIEGEVDTLVGELLVDEGADRRGGRRHPFQFDVALGQFLLEPLVAVHHVGGAVEGDLAGVGVGHRGDPHALRRVGGNGLGGQQRGRQQGQAAQQAGEGGCMHGDYLVRWPATRWSRASWVRSRW
ncbi:hypothetical protein D9M68_690410 [compost metagenome]